MSRFPILLRCIVLAGFLLPSLARAQSSPPKDRAAITERILQLEVDEQSRYQIVRDLLGIDPEVGFAALRDNWKQIRQIDAKIALINTFLADANPHVLEIIHLGTTDASFLVQNFAIGAAESVSFRAFSEDYGEYLTWRKENSNKLLEPVLRESVRAFSKRFTVAEDTTREQMLGQLFNKNYTAQTRIAKARRSAVLESGLLESVSKTLAPNSPPNIQQLGFQFLRALRPDEAYLKRVILPLLDRNQPITMRMQAITLLGNPENTWATEPLLKMLADEFPDPLFYNVGQVLAAIGDARAIPTLIAMIEADNTRETALGVGGVLAQITGVFVNEAHDGVWWRDWWRKNRLRFPPELRDAPLPKVTLRKRAPQANFQTGLQIQSELRQADGTPQSAYWLLTPTPEGGRFGIQRGADRKLGLLVVLTPDGNGANAINAWTDVARETLKGRYRIALPVAPHWTPEQKAVWLTAITQKQVKDVKFTTETFAANIVRDVQQNYGTDSTRLFLYGAQESGIPAYACSLDAASPFRGYYVVHSPFKSALLPALKTAKGRRYFLHHRKEDKASPFLSAETAQKLLTDNGATVKLVAYAEGKGASLSQEEWAKEFSTAMAWLETAK